MKKMTPENIVKSQVKDYLALKGIYNFPLTQGIASHKGIPDRIMHYQGQVHYLEFKSPKGKLSDDQVVFMEQCYWNKVPYHVIRSVEELREVVG